MARRVSAGPIYWDASALVSLFVADSNAAAARRLAAERGPHLVTTLAFAETCSVLRRIARLGALEDGAADRAAGALERAFTPTESAPRRDRIDRLARRYPLRGADLWHLAAALDLGVVLPRLRFLAFDSALSAAAAAEGLLAAA